MRVSLPTRDEGPWLRLVGLVALAWTGLVFVLLWMPPPPPPEHIVWWWDKAVHAALMAGFGGLWTWAGRPGRWVLSWGLAMGAATEVGQGLLPWERNASVGDFGADAAGLLLGWLVARALWPWLPGRRGAQPASAAAGKR